MSSTLDRRRRDRLASAPSLPFLTWYDLGTGERIELSAISFENWVAKTANLLVDEFDIAAGDRVAIALPLHWTLPVWLAACWAAGALADLAADSPHAPALRVCGPSGIAASSALSAVDGAPVVAVSLRPMGAPFAEPLPQGVLDASVEVRGQGDHFVAMSPPSPESPAVRLPSGSEIDHAGVLDLAARAAAAVGLDTGGRLLSAVDPGSDAGLLACLPMALAVGGSTVLVTGAHDADPAVLQRIRTSEAVTASAPIPA